MEKVKEIVSAFIRKPPNEIGPETVIDKSVVKGSILIHRMFAALNAEGYEVRNYAGVRTFGDLMQAINHPPTSVRTPVASVPVVETPVEAGSVRVSGVGIDIESIDQFPRPGDFREDPFYKENFTPREISYCLMKQDPAEAFAGLFSAKEAIVKASDGKLEGRPFLDIEIAHSASGKPEFGQYQLSISHASGLAVAVALATT